MDKSSMILGWLVGRRIAGQRSKKTITGYSYNGTILPVLPEWDQETHPYAYIAIYKLAAFQYATLYVSQKPFYINTDGKCHCDDYTGLMTASMLVTGTEWSAFETKEWDQTVNGNLPTWSNYDILDSTGEVYLSASDPVPVYDNGETEEPEQTGVYDDTWPIEWNTLAVVNNVYAYQGDDKFYKISNLVPTADEMAGCTLDISYDGTTGSLPMGDVAKSVDGCYAYAPAGEIDGVLWGIGITVAESAGEYDGMTVPEPGMYVMYIFTHSENADYKLYL